MALEDYRRKRRFGQTPEPDDRPRAAPPGRRPIFVVQLHHASHRHYDFRLQVGDVLRSWAVPKGPSLDPSVKRMAVEVEDHPLDYAGFEGEIPAGHYGAGHVALFDRGTWTTEGDVAAQLAKGHLRFTLHGDRLKGGWHLVRSGKPARQPQWLLFKQDDAWAGDAEADDLLEGVTPPPASKRGAEQGRGPAADQRAGPAAGQHRAGQGQPQRRKGGGRQACDRAGRSAVTHAARGGREHVGVGLLEVVGDRADLDVRARDQRKRLVAQPGRARDRDRLLGARQVGRAMDAAPAHAACSAWSAQCGQQYTCPPRPTPWPITVQPQWAHRGARAWMAHSKQSNTPSPRAVCTVKACSYSLPQTSHLAIGTSGVAGNTLQIAPAAGMTT